MGNETANAKDRRLIGYLLGQLSETEHTELEDRYFADDALFEYLAAVETELIDTYVRGELPEPDRVQFDKRFLGSPRLCARIALARQLQARTVPLAGMAAGEKSGPPQPVARKPPPAFVGVVAAVVIVAAAVVGWWRFQSTDPQAAGQPAAPAARPRVPFSLPPAPAQPAADHHPNLSGPIALALAPGSTASRDGHAMLTMPQGADFVLIQIDHEGPARERYAVIVSTPERQRVWTELNMTARAPGAKGVILEIPAASLPAGNYILTLSGGATEAKRLEAVADYSFRVR
jgi:anti-sigma factor RsiW